MNFDYTRDLLTDPMRESVSGVMRDHVSENRVQPGTVVKYDAKTNTAAVLLHNAGGEPLWFPIRTTYQGPTAGTGSAVELYPGQQVHVVFENGQATGRVSRGIIDLAYFTGIDQFPPRSASWANPQTTGGKITVYPKEGGKIGNVEHIDNQSNQYRTDVGSKHVDDWGNTSVVRTGPNDTQSAKKTRDSAQGLGSAASKLKG